MSNHKRWWIQIAIVVSLVGILGVYSTVPKSIRTRIELTLNCAHVAYDISMTSPIFISRVEPLLLCERWLKEDSLQ